MSCDDGDLCTEEDTCSSGVCGGVLFLRLPGSGIWLDGEEQCSLQAPVGVLARGPNRVPEFGQYVLNPAKRDGDLTSLVWVWLTPKSVSVESSESR